MVLYSVTSSVTKRCVISLRVVTRRLYYMLCNDILNKSNFYTNNMEFEFEFGTISRKLMEKDNNGYV